MGGSDPVIRGGIGHVDGFKMDGWDFSSLEINVCD